MLAAVLALAALQGAPAFVPYDEAQPILAVHGRDVAATAIFVIVVAERGRGAFAKDNLR